MIGERLLVGRKGQQIRLESMKNVTLVGKARSKGIRGQQIDIYGAQMAILSTYNLSSSDINTWLPSNPYKQALPLSINDHTARGHNGNAYDVPGSRGC